MSAVHPPITTVPSPRFDLVEAMRFQRVEGFIDLERHLERMRASAEELGFVFDRHHIRNELHMATFRLDADQCVRLLVARSGAIAVEVRMPPPSPAQPMAVALAMLTVEPDDPRLRHRTTNRAFRDDSRTAAGADEVVFVDRTGHLTEGSYTSLFVQRGAVLVTPPLARVSPGVLRGRLIDEGRAIEGALVPQDLATGFLLGNAVCGLMPARLVAATGLAGL